jgi:hypothetical protein
MVAFNEPGLSREEVSGIAGALFKSLVDNEHPGLKGPSRLSDEDKEGVAELLFQEIKMCHEQGKPIPNRAELSLLAVKSLGIYVTEGPECARRMEELYSDELRDLGYQVK